MGSFVQETNLFIHDINGHGDKFERIAGIIRDRETLPDFEATRFMLLLEETLLNKKIVHHLMKTSLIQ